MNDTYTIHDFEGTGDFTPCFTVSRASYRLHRPVSSFLLPGAGSERRRGICLRKSERKSIVAFRSCRADGLVGGTEAGGADSAFRGITGNMETAAEKDPPGRSVRVPDGGK